MQQQAQETLSAAAAKAAPPATVATATIAGYSLSDWVLWATLLYTLLQTALVIRRLLVQQRIGSRKGKEPACAEECPAVRRSRNESGMAQARLLIATLALSGAGLVGIVLNEGYTDRATIPVAGDVPTIGFGTTTHEDGSPVQPGEKTTPPRALERAMKDVRRFEGALKRCVTVPLHQHEYDVYVDLAYNIGASAFCGSTLVMKLNKQDYSGACREILRWNKQGGKELPGLAARRERGYRKCIGG